MAIELSFDANVHCPPERVFDVIADLRGQDRWLGRSSAFRGTAEISSSPCELGTTYVEPGPLGVRNGTVVECERPTTIAFHQPMTLRFALGTIDICMRYTLAPAGASTRVSRVVTLTIPGHLKLLQPILLRAFRAENLRTLGALKAYAETLA